MAGGSQASPDYTRLAALRSIRVSTHAVAWGYLTTEEREKLLNGADVPVKAADGRARAKRSGSTFSRRSKLTPAAASY